MTEVSSRMSATPALSSIPTEGPGSTPVGNTFNESHPSKQVVGNTETENEGRKPSMNPQISCEYFPFRLRTFTNHRREPFQSPFLATFQDLPTSYHSATRQIQTKFSLALYLLRVMDTHYIIRTQYLSWTTTSEIRVESALATSAS
jgi:hypothetical protein